MEKKKATTKAKLWWSKYGNYVCYGLGAVVGIASVCVGGAVTKRRIRRDPEFAKLLDYVEKSTKVMGDATHFVAGNAPDLDEEFGTHIIHANDGKLLEVVGEVFFVKPIEE